MSEPSASAPKAPAAEPKDPRLLEDAAVEGDFTNAVSKPLDAADKYLPCLPHHNALTLSLTLSRTVS